MIVAKLNPLPSRKFCPCLITVSYIEFLSQMKNQAQNFLLHKIFTTMNMLKVLYFLFRVLLKDKNSLLMENPALRQQLAVQQKTISRPRLKH